MGGGTKARKAVDYETFLRENGYNAVVTCGGIHSNHNRAIALMAMANGWNCHLVYHGEESGFKKGNGNAGLVMMSGAETEFVPTDGISKAMDNAMARYQEQGLKPFYIHGGGHDLPGGTSFVEAVKELKRQCDEKEYKPDYIFHATGTGSTQAGIAVGLDLVGWSDVKLIGISVARPAERGKKIVVDFANMLATHYGVNKNYEDDIIFDDSYVGSGYDKKNKNIIGFVKKVHNDTGLLVDTTYSGKALYGMMDYIKKNDLKGNFLFWLSGGPLNAIN